MNKFCTNCGNPLPADATACPVCGQPVNPVSSIPDVKAADPVQPEIPVAPKATAASDEAPVVRKKTHTATDEAPVIRKKKHAATDEAPVVRKKKHAATDEAPVVRKKTHAATDEAPVVRKKKHVATDEAPAAPQQIPPVQPQPEIPVPEPEPIAEPKSGSKTGLIALIAGLVIAIGVGGYFGWNMYSERQLWDEVCQSTELADYERYLNRFPNGAHHALAMARYNDLKSTFNEWTMLESEADYDLYREFVRSHPESVYRELALQRMDSIAWSDALRADDIEGYREYLERMPKGQHAEEASTKLENMEMRELTPMEEDRVTDVISSFFNAAEYNNVDAAITHFPAEFTFMGRAANKVHVINYVRSLHDEEVERVSVTPSNFVVKKDVDEKRNITYAVTFNLDVRTIYDGDNPDVFTSYTGAAIVDSNDMITSLALRRVASM